jgi:hypothetical protein
MGDEGGESSTAVVRHFYLVSNETGKEVYSGHSLRKRNQALKDLTGMYHFTSMEISLVEGSRSLSILKKNFYAGKPGDSNSLSVSPVEITRILTSFIENNGHTSNYHFASPVEVTGLLKFVLGSPSLKLRF